MFESLVERVESELTVGTLVEPVTRTHVELEVAGQARWLHCQEGARGECTFDPGNMGGRRRLAQIGHYYWGWVEVC